MIDRKAFRSLTSGLCLITSRLGDRKVGCVVNTFEQVASEPPAVAVALNKENVTATAVLEAGRFAATALSEDAPMELIGTFGFHESTDIDKFADCSFSLDDADIPFVTDDGLARFSVRVTETIDVGTHYLIAGVVEEGAVLAGGDPLTYAYYHAVKGGKTPPRAATFNEGLADGDGAAPVAVAPAASGDAALATGSAAAPVDGGAVKRVAWRCMVCGHIEEGCPDGLPADFTCPICGAPRDMFERIEL